VVLALPTIAASAELFAPHAWRRTDVYVAPDFEAFFPDDREGGKRLDEVWEASDRGRKDPAEALETVRRGLRRTRKPAEIVRWIGQHLIWGKPPQNADAIEIMYHASDFPGSAGGQAGETRYCAVYFGLSVVEPKTPAVLHTLVDLCMESDDFNVLHRVAWGARSQHAEILTYLKPYQEAEDAATRGKAADLALILSGELDAGAWVAGRARLRARVKYAGRLAELRKQLAEGNSPQRKDALRLIARDRLGLILDDSFLAPLSACAADADADVRRQVATLVGGLYIRRPPPQNDEAVALEVRLAQDKDAQVRADAVY
jgi:hypothetical protein